MIEDFIIKWILINLNVQCNMYTNFFESNTLDSLNFAELIAAIEQEFLIEINFEDLVEWNSVNSPKGLANFIGNLNE